MRLSIVIPVYNVERYLAKCLDSVLSQNIPSTDYEIIVVNDSSPDGSRAIAEEYADRYPNMRVLDQVPNGGPGAARNLGIAHARGKYVYSIDPDDWLDPNVLGGMLAAAEGEGVDVLTMRYREVDEQGELLWLPGLKLPLRGTVAGTEYVAHNEFLFPAHQNLLRREFVTGQGLLFRPHNVNEDLGFTPVALALAARVRFYPEVGYNYLRRAGSTVNSWGTRNIDGILDSLDNIAGFIRSGRITDPAAVKALRRLIADQLYMTVKRNLRGGYTDTLALIARVRSLGLLPMANPGGHFNRMLINRFPKAYIFYNTRLRKQKSR